MDYETSECIYTDNTRTIHHYAASWISAKVKYINILRACIGEGGLKFLVKIKHIICNDNVLENS